MIAYQRISNRHGWLKLLPSLVGSLLALLVSALPVQASTITGQQWLAWDEEERMVYLTDLLGAWELLSPTTKALTQRKAYHPSSVEAAVHHLITCTQQHHLTRRPPMQAIEQYVQSHPTKQQLTMPTLAFIGMTHFCTQRRIAS